MRLRRGAYPGLKSCRAFSAKKTKKYRHAHTNSPVGTKENMTSPQILSSYGTFPSDSTVPRVTLRCTWGYFLSVPTGLNCRQRQKPIHRDSFAGSASNQSRGHSVSIALHSMPRPLLTPLGFVYYIREQNYRLEDIMKIGNMVEVGDMTPIS